MATMPHFSSYDVLSVLTFCPPGPEERTKLSSISFSSRLMRWVIWIMGLLYQRRRSLC